MPELEAFTDATAAYGNEPQFGVEDLRSIRNTPCTTPYLPSLIQSATLSPTRIAVALVFARVIWGSTEQSATRRFSTPRTRQYWSATAMGSESGPMRQVHE